MENILNFLFPPKCLFCGVIGDVFCDNCLAECSILRRQYCVVCDDFSETGHTHKSCFGGPNRKAPTRLICTYSYEGKIRDCIKFSKYGARQFLSLRKLCREAVAVSKEMWGILQGDFCVPIPSSPKKLAYRGFNQANMIAEEVSRQFGVPLDKGVLGRTRNTEAQHTQSEEARKVNVKGSFGVIDEDSVRGRKILIVDDICTTGATFLESAKVLYEAGAADVQCFALSKREKFCYNIRA